MFFTRHHLPILLFATLFIGGCSRDLADSDISVNTADPQENIDTDSSVDTGPSSDSDVDMDSDSNNDAITGIETETGPNAGTNTDPSTGSNTDTATNPDTTTNTTDTAEEPIKIPGQAAWLTMNSNIDLINGRADHVVKWQKPQGANGQFWRVLLNGDDTTGFMAIEQTQGTTQSGLISIRLDQVGTQTLQVQLCQTAMLSPYCSVSSELTLNVTEDLSQYQSDQGERLFSSWDPSSCLTAKAGVIGLAMCEDHLSQAWLIEESQIKSANDVRLCIQADNLDYSSGLVLASCNGGSLQQWEYKAGSISNQGWSLDINTANQDVIIWHSHTGINQQWKTTLEVTEPETNTGTSDGDWARIDVPKSGPYGRYEFNVPAAQNWVNTGLFLRQGQRAVITASGLWSVKGGALYDANGHATEQSRGCQQGELTARLGLYYKDPAISCIGTAGTFMAHEDGILFVGSVVSNDLGETYEERADATGSVLVTVSSTGDTVPTVDYEDAPYYDYVGVSSGWVEIRSPNNILTLPIATAIHDASKLTEAVQRLDDIYQQHKILRGKTPYHGQPIRWFADTKDAPGWMLAGNPVRMDPALVSIDSGDRITLAAEPGNNDWGFAHELGHNFNFAGGDWYYTTYGNLEAWPNIFTLHAIDKLGLVERTDVNDCSKAKAEYLAKGVNDNGFGGAWQGLCFLSEFTDQYGWEIWQNFYQKFNDQPGHGWGFLRDRLNEASGQNVTPIFNSWNVPL